MDLEAERRTVAEWCGDWDDQESNSQLATHLSNLLDGHPTATAVSLSTCLSVLLSLAPASALPSFLAELSAPKLLASRSRLSTSLCDLIWTLDQQADTLKSSALAVQKSLEKTAIKATGSAEDAAVPGEVSMDDAEAGRADEVKAELDGIARRSSELAELAKMLVAQGIVEAEDARASWEYGFLQATGLVPYAQDLMLKQSTRLNTGLLYKQQRFNLLREESEGYAHLATDLTSSMGASSSATIISNSNGDVAALESSLPRLPTLKSKFDAVIVPGESAEKREARSTRVVDHINALIGYFDLDPNRTLDIVLDVASYNVLGNHLFFRTLLRRTHWLKDVKPRTSLASSEGWIPDGALPPSVSASKLVASLLGFKFQFYQRPETQDVTPEELYLFTAIMIWDGSVSLEDIIPHLSPDARSIKAEEGRWRNEVGKKSEGMGPRNALSMAGALDGGYSASGGSSRLRDSAAHSTSGGSTEARPPPNQRAGLITALLMIGALPEALYLLSIPSHGFLAFVDEGKNAGLLLRLVAAILGSAFPSKDSEADDGDRRASPSKRSDAPSSSAATTGPAIAEQPPPGVLAGFSALRPPAAPSSHPSSSRTTSAKAAPAEPVFFWDSWKERLPRVGNASEFLEVVWPLLRCVGPHGHLEPKVFHTVSVLVAEQIQKAGKDEEASLDSRWIDIVRWYLLPGLSMMSSTTDAADDVWKCLETLDYESRYSIYGEWKERVYQRIPELKVQRAKADGEVKRVLKTMTTDNAREKSRALARIASTNPLVAFNAALNQIQTYSNLIHCVVDCLRYLSSLAFDVLSYSIIDFLSNPDKDRSKSDGTNLAAWLQNLANFVGAAYRKASSLDPALILQYMANQLAAGNAKDLIILRELISQMSGVEILQDLSANQIVALGGSKTLRSESLIPTTMVSRRTTFSKSSTKLATALEESGLTVPLLLLVALQRQNAVLLEAPNAHLKYLGALADNCQQVLLQYVEFLRINIGTAEGTSYSQMLPSLPDLLLKFSINPSIAFLIWRPALASAIRDRPSAVKASEETADATKDKPIEIDVDEEGAVPEPDRSAMPWPPGLDDAVVAADLVLSAETKRFITPHFFATFWQLELYDIRMPEERYQSELNRLTSTLNDIDRKYAASVSAIDKDSLRSARHRVTEVKSAMYKDLSRHMKHYESTYKRLKAEKDHWLVSGPPSAVRMGQAVECLLQHCVHPRAKLSPVDAVFTALFIKSMHSLGTQSFATLRVFDRLFSQDIGVVIFPCTEFEASNYGQFLRQLLQLVKSWYDDEEAYNKSGLGKDKRGNYLPGLKMKHKDSGEGQAASMLAYENLQRVVKKWTQNLSLVFKSALDSGEFMRIRNSIAVLKELDTLVPLFETDGNGLEESIAALIAREQREDVKVLAIGYQVMLKRASKIWLKAGNASASVAAKKAPAVSSPAPAASSVAPATPSGPVRNTETPKAHPPRPEGLPSKPSVTQPGSDARADVGDRHTSSRAPTLPNGSNGHEESHKSSRLVSNDSPRSTSTPMNVEAQKREAQMRAAAQASRAAQQAAKGEGSSRATPEPRSEDRKGRIEEDRPAERPPSGPRAERDKPSNLAKVDEQAKTLAVPTGPRADSSRRDPAAAPSVAAMKRDVASGRSSPAISSTMPPPASPRSVRGNDTPRRDEAPRRPEALRRDDEEKRQERPSRPTREDDRAAQDSKRTNDDVDLRKGRADTRAAPQSRNTSRDSHRSARSNKEKPSDRRRSRSPHHRDRHSRHRDRTKDKTDGDKTREKERDSRHREDRDKGKEKDKDRERERGKEREKGKERDKESHAEKDFDKSKEARDRDRESERKDKDSERRDKDPDRKERDRRANHRRDDDRRDRRLDAREDDRSHASAANGSSQPASSSAAETMRPPPAGANAPSSGSSLPPVGPRAMQGSSRPEVRPASSRSIRGSAAAAALAQANESVQKGRGPPGVSSANGATRAGQPPRDVDPSLARKRGRDAAEGEQGRNGGSLLSRMDTSLEAQSEDQQPQFKRMRNTPPHINGPGLSNDSPARDGWPSEEQPRPPRDRGGRDRDRERTSAGRNGSSKSTTDWSQGPTGGGSAGGNRDGSRDERRRRH